MPRVPYSTNNQEVIASAEQFVTDLLSLSSSIPDIFDAAEKYPDECVLNVSAAVVHTYAQTNEGWQQSQQCLEKAKQAKQLNEREQLLLTAVSYQLDKDYQRAIDSYFLLNQSYPQDMLAAKLAEFCVYCVGQGYEGRQLLNYMDYLYSANHEDPLFLSMYSFAHELCGNYQEAERYAEQAIAARPSNAWAHHTLCHAYINQKQLEKGAKVISSFVPGWREDNDVAILCHNVWHWALFYLENLDEQKTKAIIEDEMQQYPRQIVGINVDKISLLWRMELAGFDMSDYWQDIANDVSQCALEQFVPFVNAHWFYALARAGYHEVIHEAMAAYTRYASEQQGFYYRNWSCVGKHLMAGTVALAEGDWNKAVKELQPYASLVGCVGGSDAQVDLFHQSYLVALIRAKQWGEARRMLERRSRGLALSPLESAWAGQIVG